MLLSEKTWKKDAAWGVALSVAAYLILPDVLTNVEAVTFIAGFASALFIFFQWCNMMLAEIRAKRESLSITAKRPAKRRSGKRVDFPVRRVLIIPAEKVRDGE